MKAALISVTEKGRELSLRIAENADFLSAERFCFKNCCDSSAQSFDSLGRLVVDIFQGYEALIFVCACGIAVRSVAPHLKSKTSDPAVIVIDDCGKFVVPILSGHIGGANALAGKIAELIGAQPVITTATDTGGHFSPDSFAAANDLMITDMDTAKAVAAAVLDGEKVGIVSEFEYINMPDDLTSGEGCNIGLYIGAEEREPFPVTLRLVPRNIVLGIGCKRGTACQTIENAVSYALGNEGVEFERVCAVATIDLKSNEEGLLGFCEKHRLKLYSYTSDELLSTEGDFTASDFVKNVTGVDNVCERSAVKCSGGELVMHKTSSDGVTVAAAEKKLILDFERRRL